jgi:hypothetical protein
MTNDLTTMTADELRAGARRREQDAADSFDRCDTDGFLSQWASGITAQLYRRQAELTEAGGTAEVEALFDLDGNWVPAQVISTRYGSRWMILDAEGKATGEFIGWHPKRRSTNAAKGYTEGRVRRPAKAEVMGSGTGLSGAASAYVGVRATDRPWDAPVAIVYTDRFEQEDAR